MHSELTIWLKYSLVFYIFKHLVLVDTVKHSNIKILCVNVDGKKKASFQVAY